MAYLPSSDDELIYDRYLFDNNEKPPFKDALNDAMTDYMDVMYLYFDDDADAAPLSEALPALANARALLAYKTEALETYLGRGEDRNGTYSQDDALMPSINENVAERMLTYYDDFFVESLNDCDKFVIETVQKKTGKDLRQIQDSLSDESISYEIDAFLSDCFDDYNDFVEDNTFDVSYPNIENMPNAKDTEFEV